MFLTPYRTSPRRRTRTVRYAEEWQGAVAYGSVEEDGDDWEQQDESEEEQDESDEEQDAEDSSCSSIESQHYKIGQPICKRFFKRGWFEGYVVERNCPIVDDDEESDSDDKDGDDSYFYLVEYEDGDQEHLTHNELKHVVATPLTLNRAFYRRMEELKQVVAASVASAGADADTTPAKRKVLRQVTLFATPIPSSTKKRKRTTAKPVDNKSQSTLDDFLATASSSTAATGVARKQSARDVVALAYSSSDDDYNDCDRKRTARSLWAPVAARHQQSRSRQGKHQDSPPRFQSE